MNWLNWADIAKKAFWDTLGITIKTKVQALKNLLQFGWEAGSYLSNTFKEFRFKGFGKIWNDIYTVMQITRNRIVSAWNEMDTADKKNFIIDAVIFTMSYLLLEALMQKVDYLILI